jgi:hypothetical protein
MKNLCAESLGNFPRAIRASVIHNEYLARQAARDERAACPVQATGKGLDLIQARNHDGEL